MKDNGLPRYFLPLCVSLLSYPRSGWRGAGRDDWTVSEVRVRRASVDRRTVVEALKNVMYL